MLLQKALGFTMYTFNALRGGPAFFAMQLPATIVHVLGGRSPRLTLFCKVPFAHLAGAGILFAAFLPVLLNLVRR
ncbi:hypothetical protein GKIL_3204 [Gloeobacter kilaueensis JS1]|uniref:Uncharacterized protein n=1 Tax=Gloeobacter kilaueensis (strain ATCC BAA-2537 / CCAP 1431/1 / ULC 316 / JS1) TaxID=1183438 RepID=U5QP71_GLOK1|nr:hypothetical protein GKIL_3204 [Gloeobacter kilaueensis JS1]